MDEDDPFGSLIKEIEEDVPFGSLIKQCLPTSSQQEILRTCPFARQSELFSGDDADSPEPIGIPVESTGIVMLSPPEDFHTPPEDSLSASSRVPQVAAVDCCTESKRAADLGKDSDEIAFESPCKKLKLSVENLGVSEPSRDCNRDNNLLIREIIHRENADTEVVDLGAEEIGEGSGGHGHGHKVFVDLTVRETDVVEVNKNGNRGALAWKNVEDLDKFKYVRPSSGGGLRELPSSIRMQEKNTGEEREMSALAGKNRILKGLLDALKLVAGEMGDGSEVEFDFLETAKRRGMTFPRPRWWPTEGYESYDKCDY